MMRFCCGADDDFQLIQRTFMEKHYQEFDDSEENKLIYTSIFNEYVRYFFLFFVCITFLIFIKASVRSCIPGFTWSRANILPAVPS